MLKVHEFISLDCVFENPSWTAEFEFDPAMGNTIGSITGSATGILLGRKTFDMFAPVWSTRSADDDPGAPFFNDTQKLVVGSQKPAHEWANTTRLGAYDPAAIHELVATTDGDIYVSGSGRLVRALIADGLVDELHLFIYPVMLGTGERLWDDTESARALTLLDSDVYSNGVIHTTYRPVRS